MKSGPVNRALVSEALGRLRDADRTSVDDALGLLRHALDLDEDYEPVENTRWCPWCRSIRSPAEARCLNCDGLTREIT